MNDATLMCEYVNAQVDRTRQAVKKRYTMGSSNVVSRLLAALKGQLQALRGSQYSRMYNILVVRVLVHIYR